MRFQKMPRWIAAASAAVALLSGFRLSADDAQSAKEYETGLKLYNDRKYNEAASSFKEAEFQAKSNNIKANSTLALIGCWRMCEMPYREFQAIEQLLDRFPEFADFQEMIRREYQLADLYYQGKREPAFYAMRWIPWLHDSDKSAEIYTAAIKRAPFAPEAPLARLRLAYLLDQQGKIHESLKELRAIIEDYPENPVAKIALLALANGLYELARRGDGDGGYAAEAEETLRKFEKRYPTASEIGWCKRRMLETKDIRAQRLLDIAEFYKRAGRTEATERYLAQILRDYPDSLAAAPSEKLLVTIDTTFVPMTEQLAPGARLPAYKAYPIPEEATRILLAPGENGNPYLLPIPDLKGEVLRVPEKKLEPAAAENKEKRP